MEFGCCSSYIECSDNRKCVRLGENGYDGCAYRRNLDAGHIFYGKNKTNGRQQPAHTPTDDIVQKSNQSSELYIACYNNLFGVYGRRRDTFSSYLKEEDVTFLVVKFEELQIPYRTCRNFDNIPGNTLSDESPCNSRVVFEIDDKEYHILNHNSYLIKPVYAQKIKQALEAKGIIARTELRGQLSKPVEKKKEVVEVVPDTTIPDPVPKHPVMIPKVTIKPTVNRWGITDPYGEFLVLEFQSEIAAREFCIQLNSGRKKKYKNEVVMYYKVKEVSGW